MQSRDVSLWVSDPFNDLVKPVGGLAPNNNAGAEVLQVRVTLYDSTGAVVTTASNSGGLDAIDPGVAVHELSFTYGFNGVSWDRIRSYEMTGDTVGPPNIGLLGAAAYMRAYDAATDVFVRVRSFGANTDAFAVPTLGLLGAKAFPYLFNGVTFDRAHSLADNADAIAVATVGLTGAVTRPTLFNGATFDRARSLADNADNVAVATVGLAGNVSRLTAFDGTTYDRLRTGSIANLTAASTPAPLLMTNPGQWAIQHQPATNVQATISRAAGGVGVRHVCTTITATLVDPTTAAVVLVNLRDGATGAGTILWSARLASFGPIIALSGLNIPGSDNTAMTLEFAAAGGVGVFENVSLTGYDIT